MMRALSLAIFAAYASPAWPHSWYDGECCSEHDCRQTTLGEVKRTDEGWLVVPLNITVPFSDPRVRHSQDPLIHVCEVPGGMTNGIQNAPTLRCIYIPDAPT